MATIHPVNTPAGGEAEGQGARVVRVAGSDERDPAEPWERPASEADLAELSTRRFERLPHRPASSAEIPPGSLEALRPVIGDLEPEQLFVIPQRVRMTGARRAHWVLSPTEVLAVGGDRLAVWLDDPSGPRVRAVMPIDAVLAVLDRTVLLSGRLELVGRETSVIVRYNTVGRADVRALLRRIRAAAPRGEPPAAVGRDPRALPHKWMALVRSPDVAGGEHGPIAVAAGGLSTPRPILHTGIAVLTARELIVATDPTPDVWMAQYGFDLVVVPRERVLALEGHGSTLAIAVDAWPGRVEVRIAAHPSLVAEAGAMLGPLVDARGH